MSANFFDKQPSEIFTIAVDYTDRLDTGETIVSKTIVIVEVLTGTDRTSTMLRTSSILGAKVLVGVQAGTTGIDYKITVKATTNGSNVLEEEVIMHVIEE